MQRPHPFRKRYIINARFQMRWSVFLALIAGFAATLFAVPLLGSINTENKLLHESLGSDARLYSASEDITILLMNMEETRLETSEVAGSRFDEAYASFEALKKTKTAIIEGNELQKTLVLVSVPFLAIILFAVGIFVTHSVAGPLYVIKQQLETYETTRSIDERALRSGDEFTDVYATMCRVLGKSEPPGTPPGTP